MTAGRDGEAVRSPGNRPAASRRRTVLRDVAIVRPDTLLQASDVVLDRQGCVLSVTPSGGEAQALLAPPAVDLHLDMLRERRSPRATVELPLEWVLGPLDSELAACGVGTVCIGARFEDAPERGLSFEGALELCRTVQNMAPNMICDWRVHARVEAADPAGPTHLALALAEPNRIALVSVMEHSAARTRFASMEEHRAFYAADWGVAPEDVDAHLQRQAQHGENVEVTRVATAELARRYGLPLASHDDRQMEDVDDAWQLGASVAEFPLSLEAAAHANQLGMLTVLGAPNAVRGKSTAPGNLTVTSALDHGVCDILCSDYLPESMLRAPLHLHANWGLSLPHGYTLTAWNPGKVIGVAPEVIEVGNPLDAAVIALDYESPRCLGLFRSGRLVYARAGFTRIAGEVLAG